MPCEVCRVWYHRTVIVYDLKLNDESSSLNSKYEAEELGCNSHVWMCFKRHTANSLYIIYR